MSTNLYPGKGRPLWLAHASFPKEPVWAGMRNPTEIIPTARNSIGMPVNAGLAVSLNILYAAAPAGTAFSVMYDIDPSFANEYAIQAVAAVALQTLYTWSVGSMVALDGFIRIANSGGQNISEAYGQLRPIGVTG